jgi:hypothetical protein
MFDLLPQSVLNRIAPVNALDDSKQYEGAARDDNEADQSIPVLEEIRKEGQS